MLIIITKLLLQTNRYDIDLIRIGFSGYALHYRLEKSRP